MRITINEGTSFLITDEWGDIAKGTEQGLYEQDTRFLSEYHLTLDGVKPTLLSSHIANHYSAIYYLTNPPIPSAPADTISISRRRYVGRGLHDDLDIINHNQVPILLSVELTFDSDFADIFEVKTESLTKTGVYLMELGSDGKSVSLNYSRGEFIRKLMIEFSASPIFKEDKAIFKIRLKPREKWHLCVDFLTLTSKEKVYPQYSCTSWGPALERSEEKWRASAPRVFTNYDTLRGAYNQSLSDLEALTIHGNDMLKGNVVLAAGIPWFMTFFGRDALITAYQSLIVNPALAKGTLRALAKYQGEKVDLTTEEEPGKILHEIRFGELATLREIPQTPYYGTVDATPLFLTLISETYRWTGDLNLVADLKENALRALDWIDTYGDLDGDGYLEYEMKADKGLSNQGWKDSGDSIRFADGQLAESPIALCEVQGYVYDAKMRMAELFEILEEKERADHLRKEAHDLKARFNKDFWVEDKAYFALALDSSKRKVDAVTSNPGHLLWSGIVERKKAKTVAKTLLSPVLFSGWGIRTMGQKDDGYNPLSYHNGSVWPHDNSLIIAGLSRYGFYAEAKKVIEALLEAASFFPRHRLPELFCGYDRQESSFPVEYPTSSSPQAWASGSIPFILTTMLGLSINALQKKIWIKPVLPKVIKQLKVESIKVGKSPFNLELAQENSRVRVNVTLPPRGFEVIVG